MTAMTPDKVEAALGTFIEQMDILRDDFVRYQEGQKSVPFVVLRESLVAALSAYDECNLTSALAEVERDAARYRFIADRACDVIMCASSTDYGDGDTTFGARVEVDPDQFPIKRYGHPKAKLDAAIDAAMKDTGCELSDAEIDATTDYRGHDPDYDRKDTDHAR